MVFYSQFKLLHRVLKKIVTKVPRGNFLFPAFHDSRLTKRNARFTKLKTKVYNPTKEEIMSKVRTRGENIRRFIIQNLEKYPDQITTVAAKKFNVSRQAIYKHIKKLTGENALIAEGSTRNRRYKLHPLVQWHKVYKLSDELAEDVVWRRDIEPQIGNMPENIVNIWNYGFTEMFNNAIDHSEAENIMVRIKKTAASTQVVIYDNGVGIFKKIQKELDLLDEKHAVLELAKGKLTTDPAHHTGEGIFFTSRVFDAFDILSGGVFFTHTFGEVEDWVLNGNRLSGGTFVWMKLNNHTSRTVKNVFDSFTSGDDYGFTKTVVPVKLALYGDDRLVSRSQAKRVLARIDRFKVVIFDFEGVESIGQAFADEVFRVFANEHPQIELIPLKANKNVRDMIKRALSKTY